MADHEDSLPEAIDAMLAQDHASAHRARPHADPSLTDAIRAEIMA
ncbi:MAG: hypothetical protein AAF479_09690 [Pseudomonadota bacterium]